ncbi:MAG TPA: RNA methyltransferase [Thermomicrobiaceae bacterium]|nr:RNA methyltransferase [Thermomicrobiaceae bacterium]
MTITSRSNATIKAIRKLRLRGERERAGCFFVEGVRQVAEAVQLGAPLDELIVAPELLRSPFARELVADATERGVPVLEVSPEVFRSLSLKEHPQGLAAVVRQRWAALDEIAPRAGLCWLALEAVADPGNLGTILRTAEAVGAGGVILLGPSTDPYDPTAVRASTGAVFSQPLVRATLAAFAAWAGRHGLQVAGASPAAALDYAGAPYQRPLVLLLGSERQGLSPDGLAICDLLVRIPMAGRSDSLNLAVATGIVLYEIFNQARLAT